MQIHGPNDGPIIRADSAQTDKVGGKPHIKSEKSLQGNAGAKASAVHVTSPEILALLEQLQKHPEVRNERVSEVAGRLANGEYDTREAARQTAARIIDGSL